MIMDFGKTLPNVAFDDSKSDTFLQQLNLHFSFFSLPQKMRGERIIKYGTKSVIL